MYAGAQDAVVAKLELNDWLAHDVEFAAVDELAYDADVA